MSPNFWGCRCCKTGRVAYLSSASRYALVGLGSGQNVLPNISHAVADNGIWSDVLFLTKDRVAMKSQFAYKIYDGDTPFASGGKFNSGGTLSKNDDEFLVTANEAGNPSGRFRPFKCDYDGNVTLVIAQDATLDSSPSTIVPLFQTANPDTSSAIDSLGACYFAGTPWNNSDNYYGLWKIDPNGEIEWRVDTRQESYLGMRPCSHVVVDSSDCVYFVRWFFSGSVLRPVLYKLDSDGNEIWTMDFDYSTDPFIQYGAPVCKKLFIDSEEGWLYISQSQVVIGASNTLKIRRYSTETGEKDETYDPYYWPHIREFRIERRSGDIIALPYESNGNLIRYAADDGALKWVHGMNAGGHVSISLDVWQV